MIAIRDVTVAFGGVMALDSVTVDLGDPVTLPERLDAPRLGAQVGGVEPEPGDGEEAPASGRLGDGCALHGS